ncbi:hypothetical protein OGAPHI_005302 [Ogataea philodendri]|uniref:Elongator complex protein 6 n=1 Tax=Ogataea philodendri TaxID=1378263 RepID=A0A9P8P1Y5_9ASCO|nr:uncharacterized protein OGAPHI_005302 [Ogataea philodendri]KAH3663312.1 hypothetical protein OGAPHI_005302 [Ogataea philodendri]
MSSSSDLQQQDLVVFEDHSIVPRSSSEYHYLTLILFNSATRPTWLVTALVENSLFGTCYLNKSPISRRSSTPVVLASLNTAESTYRKQLARLKGDLAEFKYVDLLSNYSNWFEMLSAQIDQLAKKGKPNVFLENPEFLLFLSDTKVDTLLLQLQKLNAKCNLFLISSNDESLLEYSEIPDDLATIHTSFLTKLVHRSNLLMSLRPLKTGRAVDVTGELTICRGLIDSPQKVAEKEYLYLVNKEGTVKLFYR